MPERDGWSRGSTAQSTAISRCRWRWVAVRGDPTSARPKFAFALETGERFDDNDLRTLARLGLGRSSILLGDDAVGLALLDDAMVAVTAGEASPAVVGIVYCAVIEACQLIFDLRRAREWTAALSRWCDAQPELVPFRGACLIHRAEIMTFNGAWANAMDEVVRACVYLAETHNIAVGDALYRAAELCRLRGQFEEAEAFYMEASDGGREPQPGLALLRLAQGQTPTAAAALRRALAEDHPPLERARLLAPYIEVLLATDDVTEAGAASEELTALAGASVPVPRRLAARSSGAVALADGAAAQALNLLRSAWSTWCDLEVPYEAARARVLIGLACRELGDEESAEMDLHAARHTFADLGAARTSPASTSCSRPRHRPRPKEQPAHRPRGRGVAARRRRQDKPSDRRDPRDQREDSRPPHQQHLREDQRLVPFGGDGLRLPARPHMTACAEIPTPRSVGFAHFARCATRGTFRTVDA